MTASDIPHVENNVATRRLVRHPLRRSPRELLEMRGWMKTIVRALLVAALACASGCAHSDWIEGTLVTVDVTGTWQSTAGGLFELALEQQGARVKGSMRVRAQNPSSTNLSGPVDGTVAGDTFSFRGANGSIRGEMTVSEDEMIGEVRGTGIDTIRRSINLRRVDSSARPRSQQP